MTSYFIKFMLLLMVTLSISQANATVVYYKNTNNWETPTAHIWNGGEGTNWPGKAMTNLGYGWYSIDAGSNKNIQFNNGKIGSDNEKTGDLEIPQKVSATAYVDGKWETVTYKLYHPWNVDEWDLKPLTDDGDGFYSLTGKWGDNGCELYCYINGTSVGASYWIENITLENKPQKGDECTFTFNPADKSLTVTKGKPLPYKAVYIFGGVNVNEWDNTEKYVKMECNEGVYTYNFTYDGKSAVWAFYALRKKAHRPTS